MKNVSSQRKICYLVLMKWNTQVEREDISQRRQIHKQLNWKENLGVKVSPINEQKSENFISRYGFVITNDKINWLLRKWINLENLYKDLPGLKISLSWKLTGQIDNLRTTLPKFTIFTSQIQIDIFSDISSKLMKYFVFSSSI